MNTWSKEINLDDYAECKEFRIHYYTRRMNGGYNSHLFLVNWDSEEQLLKGWNAIIILVENFDGMKLFLIGGMEDLNFNYCYKITYESGETYDRRRNELSVEISKEDYKKIITGVLQERPIEQIEGISDVIDKMTENVEFADRFMNKNGSLRKHH